MAKKKPRRYFVRIIKGGENILIKANPRTVSVVGKVYEVDRSLFVNLKNRGACEVVEQAEALKLVDEEPEADVKALEDHNIPELKIIADAEGVDIREISKKADIIAAIRAKVSDEDED